MMDSNNGKEPDDSSFDKFTQAYNKSNEYPFTLQLPFLSNDVLEDYHKLLQVHAPCLFSKPDLSRITLWEYLAGDLDIATSPIPGLSFTFTQDQTEDQCTRNRSVTVEQSPTHVRSVGSLTNVELLLYDWMTWMEKEKMPGHLQIQSRLGHLQRATRLPETPIPAHGGNMVMRRWFKVRNLRSLMLKTEDLTLF
ncbi:hypothetical protein V8F33_014082 [Rhypophila sp. PSN 637]